MKRIGSNKSDALDLGRDCFGGHVPGTARLFLVFVVVGE
jgi:hypothetical protein